MPATSTMLQGSDASTVLTLHWLVALLRRPIANIRNQPSGCHLAKQFLTLVVAERFILLRPSLTMPSEFFPQ